MLCVLAVSTLLSCFLPCSKNMGVANAESDTNPEIYQTLISTELTNNDWQEIYGGKSSEVSNFTPFNEAEGKRLSGKSIIPESDENNQLIEKTYKLADNGGINSSLNLSFGIWFYFSDISVHSLSMKFSVDSNNYIIFTLSKDQLIDLVKKGDGINEQAFAWNYIELPLTSGTIVGSIIENDNLKKFNTITFNYNSSEILGNAKFASLRFYGLFLQDSTTNIITATIKQDYTMYSFNFWDENVTDNIVKGDILKTHYLLNAINYAWVGEVDLLNSSNLISWQIVLTNPSGNNSNYNFGENITFTENGLYLLTYKAESKSDALPINLYDYIEIYVRNDNFIYFEFPSYNIIEGNDIIIDLTIANILDLSSIEILSVESSNNGVATIESLEDFKYKVKGVSKGDVKLIIKAKAKRNGFNEEKEYEANTFITVKKAPASNHGLMIFLWVSLGIIILIGIVLAIRIIILSRRNDVR